MAKQKNLKVDYSQLSDEMVVNSQKIYEENRKSEQPEFPTIESKETENQVENTENKKKEKQKQKALSFTIYITEEQKKIFEDVIYNNRIKSRQKVINAALDYFFNTYYDYDKEKLNAEGEALVKGE